MRKGKEMPHPTLEYGILSADLGGSCIQRVTGGDGSFVAGTAAYNKNLFFHLK